MKPAKKDEVAAGCLGGFLGAFGGAVLGGVLGGALGHRPDPNLARAPSPAVLIANQLSSTLLGVFEGFLLGGSLGGLAGAAVAYEWVLASKRASDSLPLAPPALPLTSHGEGPRRNGQASGPPLAPGGPAGPGPHPSPPDR